MLAGAQRRLALPRYPGRAPYGAAPRGLSLGTMTDFRILQELGAGTLRFSDAVAPEVAMRLDEAARSVLEFLEADAAA